MNGLIAMQLYVMNQMFYASTMYTTGKIKDNEYVDMMSKLAEQSKSVMKGVKIHAHS